jgi:hypothetical protein
MVGLGETLFARARSAPPRRSSIAARRDALPGEARERVLDWWASAIDREA